MSRRVDLLFILFFVSGFGGLIYESVWSHYVQLFLGHAAYAQTLVLIVFIGGLALGSWICARVAEKLANPLRAYAWVEGAIGLFALVFHAVFIAATDWGYAVLLPATCEQASPFCASQWLLAAALLFPQSVLLGMTFPLMSSAVLRIDPSQPGHHIAALYFFNSFGAVLGVLASAFVLIPAVGLPGTLRVAGVANVLIALVAYSASRSAPGALVLASRLPPQHPRGRPERLLQLLLATALLTGLSSFIYEIAWIRMLGLVFGASTRAFELMLAAFILGLALGGLWIRSRIDAIGDTVRFLAIVQLVMGLAAALTIAIYNGAFDVMAWLLSTLARNNGGYLLFNLSATAIALAVMLPATFCAGMTLPLITHRLLHSRSGERALGLVYAVNTLGSIIGVVVAVHILLPGLGLGGTLVAGAAIDVGLGIALLVFLRPAGTRWGLQAGAAAVALAAMALGLHIDPRKSASGVFRSGSARIGADESVAFHRDGKTATVDVVDTKTIRSIRTNGKPDAALPLPSRQAATNDEFTMTLLGLLPMGHQPRARSAAVIGFGSGMTTSVLLTSPTLERVDTVEIEPAMVEGARLFGPAVAAAFDDPRSHVVIDDAKSYFARGRNRYDIIVSEPSNPWVSGVASLFTTEFYARLATYLNDDGVLCQWLHTYDMDARTLASILGAVSTTFPDFVLYSSIDSDLVLVARKKGATGTFDASVLGHPKLAPLLERLQLKDGEVVKRRAIASWFVLGPFFGQYGAPANSDFQPVVDQWAPRDRYTQAKVRELVQLQSSSVPLLEMIGHAAPPSRDRQHAIDITYLEAATDKAWKIRDIVMGEARERDAASLDPHEMAAWLVRLWATRCPADLSFRDVLPALVSVAEDTTPRLHPDVASRLWQGIVDSSCAKKLAPEERDWLALFESTARRDTARMAETGIEILRHRPGQKNSASEYAFFAAVTALVTSGDARRAVQLLELGAQNWVQPGEHYTEVRFIEAAINAAARRSP